MARRGHKERTISPPPAKPDPLEAIDGIFELPGHGDASTFGAGTLSCPECGAAAAVEQRFCEACGAVLGEVARRLEGELLPALRRARRWILLIGLLYGLRALLGATLLAAAAHPVLLALPNLALLAIHLGLFWWARSAPLGAAIAALVLFVSHQIADAVLGASVATSELLIKLVFAVVLWQAVRAGLEVRKQRPVEEP